ncbi:MAG: L-rhamnose mutarotase [Bacteroidota bacterium]
MKLKKYIWLVLGFALWSCNSPSLQSKNFNNSYSKASVSILEIVGRVNTAELFKICLQNKVLKSNIYQWNDHVAIYNNFPIQQLLIDQLKLKFPGTQFKVYDGPFYRFERSASCNNKDTAKEWNNILLTANLVADPKMQQEYLDYHKTQFEKWPEVSNGFCNASFQQLLVFKNGRQLMLVISIPKGKTLDELNPLTTKNNPRVDDWNKLMSKYQEGLPGTKRGETWVFLKPLGSLQ